MNTTNERPTPETDALRDVVIRHYKDDELTGNGMGNILVALADIESLERERDEAREELKITQEAWVKAKAERVEALRERDEAREELENHFASTVHTCHDKCKRPMCVLLRERDEARAESLEQSRLLGMSSEREAKLLAQLAAERSLADRLASILRLYHADDTIAHLAGVADALEAWKGARND